MHSAGLRCIPAAALASLPRLTSKTSAAEPAGQVGWGTLWRCRRLTRVTSLCDSSVASHVRPLCPCAPPPSSLLSAPTPPPRRGRAEDAVSPSKILHISPPPPRRIRARRRRTARLQLPSGAWALHPFRGASTGRLDTGARALLESRPAGKRPTAGLPSGWRPDARPVRLRGCGCAGCRG